MKIPQFICDFWQIPKVAQVGQPVDRQTRHDRPRDRESAADTGTIGHIDHGKTTLVDEMLRQSGAVRDNAEMAERAMDSNDIEREEYYRWDRTAFARGFGVEADAVFPGAWLAEVGEGPPPRLADMPPARHVGYALTWFGIALTLVGVYVAFHVRAGRLRFSRDA